MQGVTNPLTDGENEVQVPSALNVGKSTKVQDNKHHAHSSQMLPSALSYSRRERALRLRNTQSRGKSHVLIPKPKFITLLLGCLVAKQCSLEQECPLQGRVWLFTVYSPGSQPS